MDYTLRSLKWEVYMYYLDDDVIFRCMFSEHNTHLNPVLECLGEARLVLNLKNCRFGERTLVLGT